MPKLNKSLKLIDVYAICTGAMFSSGFFLLPGIAAVEAGPSVVLAYLLAGVMILPSMFAVAELSTAMPRAGGAYYFLDRSMGPLIGTIGGLGTWLSLVLKSAFALLGMGAYLVIFFDVPIEPLAAALTVAFAILNLVGAKETSGLQRVLVGALVAILAFFTVRGLWVLWTGMPGTVLADQMTPFAVGGVDGLLATVGIVFVSYAGLTKVGSVAEEVEDPDRAIPLGMMLSLATATIIYVLGVLLMVALLDMATFHKDLTPVASVAGIIFGFMPKWVGLGLVVAAAVAAFASTGNAGILASSRYPLAMARDGLLPGFFARLTRRGTPAAGILATSGLMLACILFFDITAVAKLASAFGLLIFGLLNAAVIVMRESKIDYYRPGFRAPLYPWLPIAGILISLWLIAEMGWLAILFTAGVVVLCAFWYAIYGRKRADRTGAIYHVFERLGRRVHRGLDHELRSIFAEKGLDAEDPFEEVVTQANVLDVAQACTLRRAVELTVSRAAASTSSGDLADTVNRVLEEARLGLLPMTREVAMAHLQSPAVQRTELVLLRAKAGIERTQDPRAGEATPLVAFMLLLSPVGNPGSHLRILAQLARHVEAAEFGDAWMACRTELELKEALLREGHFMRVQLAPGCPSEALIGCQVSEAQLPQGALIAQIQRAGAALVPNGRTVLRSADRLTLIGTPDAIELLRSRLKDAPVSIPSEAVAPSQGELGALSPAFFG